MLVGACAQAALQLHLPEGPRAMLSQIAACALPGLLAGLAQIRSPPEAGQLKFYGCCEACNYLIILHPWLVWHP